MKYEDCAAGRLACLERWVRRGAYKARDMFLSEKDTGAVAKEAGDLVTRADLEIEAMLRAKVARHYPGDGILGEEEGITGAADWLWIFDPVDGTANFARGVPVFSTVGGLAYRDRLVASVIVDPFLDEIYTARLGCGARLNGVPVRYAGWPTGARQHVGLGYSEGQDDALYMRQFLALRSAGYQPRDLCAGAQMILHAALGRTYAFYETAMHFWDAAPALLFASEAGSHASRFPACAATQRLPVLVCPPEERSSILALLALPGDL